MPRAEEAIVLVGGLGTRLREAVPDRPKPLAPVRGRPFLAWLLDQFAQAGLRRVVLATGHQAEAFEAAIGPRWDAMEIVFSRENEPLGTGGAVRLAATRLLGDGAFIANGDTFLRYAPGELEQCVRGSGAPLGVALAAVPDLARFGAVEVSAGRVVGFREKGALGAGRINAGHYFATAEGLACLPTEPAFSFERQVLEPWAAEGRVAAFEATRDFLDIGVPEDYRRATSLLPPAPGVSAGSTAS